MSKKKDPQDNPFDSQSNPFALDAQGSFKGGMDGENSPLFRVLGGADWRGGPFARAALLLVALLLAGGLFYFLFSSGKEEQESRNLEPAAIPEEQDASLGDFEDSHDFPSSQGLEGESFEEEAPGDSGSPLEENPPKEELKEEVQLQVLPSLQGPQDGVRRHYDLSSQEAYLQWEGTASWVEFSKQPHMSSIFLKRPVKGQRHPLPRLAPGLWFWRVRGGAGSSQVRSFEILPPRPLELALQEPSPGALLSKQGALVRWKGDRKATQYRVELARDGHWHQPELRLVSAGTQLLLEALEAGDYQLRLGAFSQISGRWEYLDPISVKVQD